jgi:hypothetical protein
VNRMNIPNARRLDGLLTRERLLTNIGVVNNVA